MNNTLNPTNGLNQTRNFDYNSRRELLVTHSISNKPRYHLVFFICGINLPDIEIQPQEGNIIMWG